jgi:hypothetical protein
MRHLFENEYKNAASASNAPLSRSFGSNKKSRLESMLDMDFDDDEEQRMDKIDRYLSEKSEAKGIDVLMWWKVSIIIEDLLTLFTHTIFSRTRCNILVSLAWRAITLQYLQLLLLVNVPFLPPGI